MTDLILGFISNIVSSAIDGFGNIMLVMLRDMLFIENMIKTAFTAQTITDVYTFIYTFVASLASLKFLKRGFDIYVLWREGDADNSPQDMVLGLGQAVVLMVTFPWLYNQLASVAIWFTKGVQERFLLSTDGQWLHLLKNMLSGGTFAIMLTLLFVVLIYILWFQMLKRGVELLILRLAMPFACIGLIDSDGGQFKNYLGQLFKAVFTSILQVLLMGIAQKVATVGSVNNIIFAIVFVTTAYSVPNLLQSFLVQGGAPNITNKIYSGAQAVQFAKGLIK